MSPKNASASVESETKPVTHEYAGEEECSLFNSSRAHAEGYSFAYCTCGWKSAPVRAKDCVTIFSAHVLQALHKEKEDG